tara:strand:- start:383 stop:1480 length:1098 start_codon:yes stop_codon:yes gene_type:complete
MGAPSITYESPKIEKDNTFRDYLQYQQDRELQLDERADQARDRTDAQKRRRREQGALGFDAFSQNLKSQLESGVTPYADAQTKLQDYVARYDLKAGFQPGTKTTTQSYFEDVLDDEGKKTGDRIRKTREITVDTPGATPGFEFDTSTLGDFSGQLQTLYTGTGEIDSTTGKKDRGIRGQRFTAGVEKAYRDLLGREGTADELSTAMTDFDNALYTSAGDFRDQLKSSGAYTKKFNDNYMDNYYDTMYASSPADRTDAEGNVSKKRKYTFDSSVLPGFDADQLADTGITLPDYEKYFEEARSVAELEDQRQGIAQTRDFIYQSGITSLQGEIEKENRKIEIQGKKDVAKIDQATNMYSNLIGSFNF